MRFLLEELDCEPRWTSALPQFLKFVFISQGVHRLPKTVMLVRCQLSIACDVLQWPDLKAGRVILDVSKNSRVKDEESCIDPSITFGRFFNKGEDLVSAQFQSA